MIQQAIAASPNEVCGLVVAHGAKCRLVQARNLAEKPRNTFDLDPDAWLEVQDDESVIGIYHSHPRGTSAPSWADLQGCETSGLPWHIVTTEGHYSCTQPSGFVTPYLERPYVHGIHDCFSIVRDWYQREWGLDVPDFPRQDQWWDKGANHYVDHFQEYGFQVIHNQEPEIGDGFFIQIASPVPNHAAVYVGKGLILHHVQNRLSTKDPYGGSWQRHTTHHLRHVSRMKEQNG